MTNKIEFTKEANEEITRIISEQKIDCYFRISVQGGGCSGFKYNFSFDGKIEENDKVFNKTVIDNSSLEIINGSVVDYKKEMIGSSFVIKNPQASSSCGCGLSFSVQMKIASWNVNSVRARIINVLDYLKKDKPDILFLQEIKTENINFPTDEFKKIGYESFVFGQKSYNGVAFLSKIKIDRIDTSFIDDDLKQSRIITGDIKIKHKKIKLINIYVPNGNPINTEKYLYKKKWLDKFLKSIKKTLLNEKNIIISGDFNIIPDEIDVYDHNRFSNDALYKIEIRKYFRELINYGFTDIFRQLKKDKQEYTFWDYMAGSWVKNYGMRIDHFLVTNNLLENIKTININKNPRGKIKPSDHTPIELEIT